MFLRRGTTRTSVIRRRAGRPEACQANARLKGSSANAQRKFLRSRPVTHFTFSGWAFYSFPFEAMQAKKREMRAESSACGSCVPLKVRISRQFFRYEGFRSLASGLVMRFLTRFWCHYLRTANQKT